MMMALGKNICIIRVCQVLLSMTTLILKKISFMSYIQRCHT